MIKKLSLLSLAALTGACFGSVDVDAAIALPGAWNCDDGIVITFDSDGRYEWRVPANDDINIYVEDSHQIRMNDDGGHSLLDAWRVDGDVLEMDMLGETDVYSIRFDSEQSFKMTGPDSFSCQRR